MTTLEHDGSTPPRFGDRGDNVRRLQATLRLLGVSVPEEESARGIFGEGTAAALRGWQESVRLEPSGLLDQRTEERARAALAEQPQRVVLGRVTTPDGQPIEGLVVRAFDANLAGDRPIADGTGVPVTDPDGRYELPYSTDELGRPGKKGADLVVRAFPDSSAADPAASSAVLYGAGPVELVPLIAGTAAPSSSYKLLLERITPALDGRNLAAIDTPADVAYLAGTTGVPQAELSPLARAAGLAAEAGRLVEGDPAGEAATTAARSVPAFYALVRANPAADLGTVLSTPPAELAGRVAEALRDGLIPVDVDPGAVARAVVDLQARRLLRPGAPGEPPSIGDILRTIPARRRLRDAAALRVSRLLAEEGSPSDGFWRRLPETGLGSRQIRDVRLAMTLNDLAGGDLRLVEALQAESPMSHDGTAAHLAGLSPNRWMEIVGGAADPPAGGAGADPAIVPAVAAELAGRVERLHPSATFRAKLEAGLLRDTGFPAARVAGFLGGHPDFDLVDTTVEPYLDDAGMADDELRSGLLTAQRMLRIGASQADLEILIAAGLGSTADFALRDRRDLIAQLRDSIPEDRLIAMHERAQYTLTGALGVAALLSPRFNESLPHSAGPSTPPSVPAGFPSIGQLFGDQSACSCGHCRSVLGPPAYLVDLLHLLDKTGFGGQLQARRPDIAELELTCENAYTTLPYVDLVLEILEAAVAFPTPDVALTPAEANQLEGGAVPAPLRTELAKHAADEIGPLGVEVAAQQVLIYFPPFRRIVVRDRKRRWPGSLWRRQMMVRWSSVRLWPATASVPDADIDATRQALAAGQAPANLIALIAPEPEAPVVGVPAVTAAAPPHDQDEHTVVLVRSMAIELVGTNIVGAIRFLTTGGALISSVQVQNILIPIAQQLANGKIHPYLANLLPPLPFTVTQEPQPANALGQWTLSATVTATVRFTPDRVVVAGLAYGSSDRTDDALFPENRDPEAYRLLNSDAALYPLELPFDLFREEVRACLAIAGSSRLELLRSLLPSRRYASADEACEVLDAAPAQLAIVTEAPGTAARVASLWGLQENGNTLADPLDGTAPPVPADWVGALSRASVLVDRSGVELPTLQAMFASRYLAEVAPDIHLDPVYECRLSRVTVAGLNRQSLDRLQRLLRLRRITGWPVRDTDLALLALTRAAGPPTGNTAIVALGHVQELTGRTHASVRTVAAWLGAVETTAYIDRETDGAPARPSLYDEVFADPRQRGPDSADFALDANGAELAYITDQGPNPNYAALSGRLGYAAAALRLRPAELAELIGPGPLAVVADRLSLASVCTLLRQASLARAAGLSVRQSRILQQLTDTDPLPGQPPAVDEAGRKILEFLDAADAVRSSGFTAEELAWCLEGTEVDGTARAERRLDQLRWLVDLQAALREIQPATGEIADTALRALLRSAGWPDSLIDRVVEGEGNELGLGSRPALEVTITANQPPALPPNGPFALTAAGSGRYVIGLTRPPAAADFTRLGQVAGLGPLAAATSPAARLSALWDDLHARTGSLTRWLQSVALPRLSRPLSFTVPAPRDGANPRALPAAGLGSAIRRTAAGDLEIDGFLTAGDALRLRTWAVGATNEDAVGAAVAPLVGVPPALGVAGAPLGYEPVLRQLTLTGYPAAADVPALAGIVDNTDYAATVQALVAAADAYVEPRPGRLLLDADAVVRLFVERPAPPQRYAAVQDALVRPLRRLRAGELVAARTGIDRRLLDALDAAAESAAQPVDLLGDLASEQLLGIAIRDTRADDALAEPLAALDRWDRAGLSVRRLGVLPAEAAWFAGATGFTGLDPLGLTPAGPGDPYKRWRAATTLYELRSIVPGAGATLERVRTAASAAAGIEDLAEAFQVAPADVTALLALDTPVGPPAGLRDPAVLRRVVDACLTLRRLRAPADALVRLCAQSLDQPAAAAARGLVLVRPDALAAAPGSVAAAGRLRDRQRAALVAYLVDRDGARDASGLHARYLLDVEMGPTLRTSRIKQAISSTQLFMQRLLLNLEGGSPTALATLSRQTAWAGSQEVWESNRNVFLYPQNWLEPSLREDKSHLFRKLEGELLQGELTTERAISLFGDYLVGLQDIAQLTVRAMYEETLTATSSVVHVLARTPDQPLRFYYRQWLLADTSRQWDPWEPVDSVTNTEHTVCFVRGRRPHIAWLQIGRAVDVQAGPTTGTADWEIELLWCFRTNDGWSAPQKWRSRLRHPVLVNKDERVSFALRVHDHGGQPQLRVYGAREIGATQQAVNPIPAGTDSSFSTRDPGATSTSHKIEVQVVGELETTTGTAYFAINEARVEIWGEWSIKYDMAGTQVTKNSPGWPTAAAPQTLTLQKGAGSAIWPVPLNVYQTRPDGTVDIFQVLERSAKVNIRVTVAGLVQTFGPIGVDPLQDSVVRRGVRYKISPDDPRFQATRPVRLMHLQSFDWDDSVGIRASDPPSDGSELTPEIPATTHESSGLREDPAGTALVLDGQPLTQATSLHQFFAVGSAGTNRIQLGAPLYVEEAGASAFLVRRKVDGTWALLPSSEYVAGDALAAITSGAEILDLGAQDTSSRVQATLAQIAPAGGVSADHADTDTQFALPNPASTYDWEVYFHIPYLIATALANQQRYAEALRWLHLIFDPTLAGSTPSDAWRFRPFRTESSPGIDQLLAEYARGTLATAARDTFQAQIDFWREHPFRPHGIARLRPRAYQWMVLYKYVEIRIAWGDLLFRRGTLESENAATQQYLLAAQLLGPRPPRLPEQPPLISPLTYAALADRWDDFSNAWISLADLPFFQAWLAFLQWLAEHGIVGPDGGNDLSDTLHRLQSTGLLVFCVPPNDRTDTYRATVANRLTKIRSSQDIDGVSRQPALYEPAIDPALLVRAVAAGLDIDTVLNDISAPSPRRRFTAALQRATEFAGEVRSLEATLLSALEKRDAEELARMRAVDERALLELTTDTRQRELDEANAALEAARQARQGALTRYVHYQRLLGKQQITVPEEHEHLATEPARLQLAGSAVNQLDPSLQGYGLTMEEVDQLSWLTAGNTLSLVGGGFQVASGIAHMVPNFTTSWFEQEVTFGGTNVGSGLGAVGQFFSMLASNASFQGTRSSIVGGHQRRYDDWVLQSNIAARDIEQADRQLLVAEIRADIARRAVETHLTQVENARRTEEFLRRKFTNQELYQWMCDRLAQAHSAAFQLAYELAKTAERALARDLGIPAPGIVRYGNWDDTRQGLLAGELLSVDLKRLEAAYLHGDERELEITKHVPLSELAPVELLRLRQTGTCEFEVPETAYDMDFAGHYFRRLRAVSVSIPCNLGPYRSAAGTLTLLASRTRVSAAPRPYTEAQDDPRFVAEPGGVQSIATSSGQNDAGLFELDFRDERYLPFERFGAISRWRFQLPSDFRPFDYRTISDLILHVRYTARDGGRPLADAATSNLRALLASAAQTGTLVRTISMRRQRPSEWHRLTAEPGTPQDIAIDESELPYALRAAALAIWKVAVFVQHAGAAENPARIAVRCPQLDQHGHVQLTDLQLELDVSDPIDGLTRYDSVLARAGLDPVAAGAPGPDTTWQLELEPGTAYDDVVIAFWYAATGQ